MYGPVRNPDFLFGAKSISWVGNVVGTRPTHHFTVLTEHIGKDGSPPVNSEVATTQRSALSSSRTFERMRLAIKDATFFRQIHHGHRGFAEIM
jgi:hypothetical protein